jgi:hypothetical protein
VLDTDGVLADGMPARWAVPRRGVREMVRGLVDAGTEVHVWSGAGARHAEDVARKAGVAQYVEAFHSKAEYPMTTESATRALGFRPDMTVDDDEEERLDGVPFYLMPRDEAWGFTPATRTSDRLWRRDTIRWERGPARPSRYEPWWLDEEEDDGDF